MKNNPKKCELLRQQIDNKSGQIKILEKEIQNQLSNILKLNKETDEAKRNYKNMATKFGVSKVPIITSKSAGNIFDVLSFGMHQYHSPEFSDVEKELNNYNNIRFFNEQEIQFAEKEINFIGNKIYELQKEKEKLVKEMRYSDCF
ncbi:MAG TPA: hypothetical protein PLF01_06540 [Alphaproteobacteria bacterium]|nr:hypothetical protein [Alphaproteobacteria bacterium]